MPKLMLESADAPEMVNDVILSGFYPIAILLRFFGYFPFNNLGSKTLKSSNVKVVRLRLDVVIFAMAILSMTSLSYYNLFLLTYDGKVNLNDFKTSIITICFTAYWALAAFVLLHFAVIKNRKLLTFIHHVSHHENNVSLIARRKKVKAIGLILPIAVTLLCTTWAFSGLVLKKVVWAWDYYQNIDIISKHVVFCYIYSNYMFAYNAIGAVQIYFNCCLRWCFEDLNSRLRRVVEGCRIDVGFSRRVSDVRQRYERLVTLVDELNALMSPILLLYIVAQSITNCINVYELVYFILQHKEWKYLLRNVIVIACRLPLLIALCVTSDSLKVEANSLDKPFNQCCLLELDEEARFQVDLLLRQLERRKAKISADNLLTVDTRLLAEILAASATYIVIMLQISSGLM